MKTRHTEPRLPQTQLGDWRVVAKSKLEVDKKAKDEQRLKFKQGKFDWQTKSVQQLLNIAIENERKWSGQSAQEKKKHPKTEAMYESVIDAVKSYLSSKIGLSGWAVLENALQQCAIMINSTYDLTNYELQHDFPEDVKERKGTMQSLLEDATNCNKQLYKFYERFMYVMSWEDPTVFKAPVLFNFTSEKQWADVIGHRVISKVLGRRKFVMYGTPDRTMDALIDDIIKVFTEAERLVGVYHQYLAEYASLLENYQKVVAKIMSWCKNDKEPVTQDLLTQFPPDQIIHMKNGYCYEVTQLVEYLRAQAGANISPFDYPKHKIWIDDQDYQHLIEHPTAQKLHLNEFMKKAGASRFAKTLSDKTLVKFRKFANIMASTGQDFIDAATNYPDAKGRFTADEMKAWLALREGQTDYELTYLILNPEDAETKEEQEMYASMKEKINNYIKLRAVRQFYKYIMRLKPEERDALNQISPATGNLPALVDWIEGCVEGQVCVMQMGRRGQEIYHAIVKARSNTDTTNTATERRSHRMITRSMKR